ncbi:APC family permease [Subtercola frigoramans]|uniref:Amino acid transporter n=1 Tax=Subtercola frigoramans TaxID=120298 RepID=A0ABS2L744_9MICO|nr:APC family permease [Subtercola frigoramans]MBM7472701.1 amino acid transporter [Subtercola frigoramans]
MTALERAIADPPLVAGILRRSPVEGLDRRSLGFLDVVAQSVSAVAPSAAATTIPVIVAAVAGNATVWAVTAALLLSLLVASSINQFTRRMSAAGSLYTFVSKGLGAGASFMTGVSMIVGYGFIAMFSLSGAGLFLATLLGHFVPGAEKSSLLVSIIVVAIAAICFVVLARGIRLSTRVTLLVESVSVALLVVFIVALLVSQGGGIDWSVISLAGTTFSDFATGAVLALMAFVGFESAASLGVEARKPFASIPRALVGTLVASGLLYLLSSYSQLVGFVGLDRSLTSVPSPVNSLANAYGMEWMGLVLDASIAMSFVACAIASTTALVRVLFSMARDGVIPRMFGRTHPRFRTPFIGVVTVLPVMTVATLLYIASGAGVWEAMGAILVCAAAGFITSYVLVCVASFVFLKKIGELTFWAGLRAILASLLLALGLVVYLAVQGSGPGAVGVWLFLGIMVAGVVVFRFVRRRRPWLKETIGVFDETIAGDVLGGDPAASTGRVTGRG